MRVVQRAFFFVAAFALLAEYACAQTVTTPEAAARAYIKGLATGSAEALTSYERRYKDEAARIRRDFPQVMWAEKLKALNDRASREVTDERETQEARANGAPCWQFIRSGAKADFLESRLVSQAQQNSPTFWNAFVKIAYATDRDAPMIARGDGSRRLRDATVLMSVSRDAAGFAVESCSIVDGAMSLWPIPTLTREEAARLAAVLIPANRRAPSVNAFLTSFEGRGPFLRVTLPIGNDGLALNDVAAMNEFKSVLSKHGFRVEGIEQIYSGQLLVPIPDTWNKSYLAPPPDNRFRLSETDEFETIDVKQSDTEATAIATVLLKHVGCTAVCAMVKDYWSTKFAKLTSDARTNFWTGWLTYSDLAPGGAWPSEEKLTIRYVWEGLKGWRALRFEVAR